MPKAEKTEQTAKPPRTRRPKSERTAAVDAAKAKAKAKAKSKSLAKKPDQNPEEESAAKPSRKRK